MSEFDTEQFIIEVQMRPALWDSRTDDYSNRTIKRKSWNELCELFIPNFNNKTGSEKSAAATDLQKKWKNVRDSYSRELKNKKKGNSGSAAELRREYIYYKQLQFLSPLSNTKRPQDKDTIENNVASPSTSIPPSTPSPAAPVPTTSTAKKRKVFLDDDTALMSLIAEKIATSNSQSEYDPDMHFILSLYDDFHKIPSEKKMDAKMELMSIIRKYNNPIYQFNTYQYGYCTHNTQAQFNNSPSENQYDAPPSSAQSNYSTTMSEFNIDTHMFDDDDSSLP